MPRAAEFERELERQLADAQARGLEFVDINAGELHRDVGGYPSPSPRTAVACSVMRRFRRPGDQILQEPPSGVGASLTIRYNLPR